MQTQLCEILINISKIVLLSYLLYIMYVTIVLTVQNSN